MRLFSSTGPLLSHVPFASSTRPPPSRDAFSIAARMAGRASVRPSAGPATRYGRWGMAGGWMRAAIVSTSVQSRPSARAVATAARATAAAARLRMRLQLLREDPRASSALVVALPARGRQVVGRALGEARLGREEVERLRGQRDQAGEAGFARLVLDVLHHAPAQPLVLV